MSVKGDRQLIAAIIGVELANQFQDDQLPALLHAIEDDALSVAACARQAVRKGVDHPPSLLLWLIREKKHTGLLPQTMRSQPELIPPPEPRTPEQEQHFQQWKRIWAVLDAGNRELRQLVREWCDLWPDPTPAQAREMRDALIQVLDEMETSLATQ